MAELRVALAAAGLADIDSFLQSGNLAVTTSVSPSELETIVSGVVKQSFGLEVASIVLEAAEFDEIDRSNSIYEPAMDPTRMVVITLREPPDAALVAESPLPDPGVGAVSLAGRFVYQWCPEGISNSIALTPWLERRWKVTATARNWRTIDRLRRVVTNEQ